MTSRSFLPEQIVCSSCGAPVRWAQTKNDKPMPLDVEKVPGGNIEVYADGVTLRCRVVPSDPLERRHVSRFATCPSASKHRRRDG